MRDLHVESQKRLQHIEKAISDIEKYVLNENLVSFCKNDMVHDAVLLQFIIIGEAIINVEEEKLSKHDYPWYKVRSFRNMIAHEYFDIKLPAVWQIIKTDLPVLKKLIQNILKKEY